MDRKDGGMRLVICGGGGFRVPLVHGEVLRRPELGVSEVVLYDSDADRLGVMLAVLEGQRGSGQGPVLRAETNLDKALAGADVVFSAMRVGGLEGRVADERTALDRGVLGQETTGVGGLTYGMRTVPVALELARTVARVAPEAVVINFTNPAGLVTEAMQSVLGDRVIGICDSPLGLANRCARAVGIPLSDLAIDYAGLNHLGWLMALRQADGVDLLPGLLANDALLDSFEEGALFDHDWLRTLGAIPNEYLHYWYDTREAIAAILSSETRGEFLAKQQDAFYASAATDPAQAWDLWREVNRERNETYMAETRTTARDETDIVSGGYEGVALALMGALKTAGSSAPEHVGGPGASVAASGGGPGASVPEPVEGPVRLILNVRNTIGGAPAVPGLPDDAVVEVPCLVDAAGIRPLPVSALPEHALGLAQQVEACNRLAIRAATEHRTDLAVAALALHPLIDSVEVAKEILAEVRVHVPELDVALG